MRGVRHRHGRLRELVQSPPLEVYKDSSRAGTIPPRGRESDMTERLALLLFKDEEEFCHSVGYTYRASL